jgi:hypothetical protein
MTPNLAFGFNNGLESAATLTNHLKTLLSSTSSKPTTEVLTQVFKTYQSQRFPRAKESHDLTALYTSFCAWENIALKYASKLLPRILGNTLNKLIIKQLGGIVQGGVKLEFLDVPERKMGNVPFDDEKDKGMFDEALFYGAVLVGVVGSSAWVLHRFGTPLMLS